MEKNYLDITKSVMISSPAGSGKTEKLARRYIALLRSGSEVERILAITFTDKAAAEMKERILNILKKEDPGLFEKVREKMPRMRISTIHSFCLKLLKRFCLDLDMDLAVDVLDGFNASTLWEEALYESLLEDGATGEMIFYGAIRRSGIKGWNKLCNRLKTIHEKRPDIEFGLREMGLKVDIGSAEQLGELLSIYAQCLGRYRKKKRERHCVDYNDLELMAYEAVSSNPEWQNILYSFDEHTDHILVDEFQDTSLLQWLVVDKLTEEWRSGLGAKRESGTTPTIFLVGDDKQSIYSFRGADSGIFRNAGKRLSEWLGDEYHFIEVKENYRSLPAVVDFVNLLFGKLMSAGLYEDWKVRYVPFEPTRQGKGEVELVLCELSGNTKENRRYEGSVVAKRIKKLCAAYEVYDGAARRRCGYGDMAILLRNRTYLGVLEDALRKEGIPFIVVKGIGFYHTPEIGILRDLLFTLIDPQNDYSLFNVLRSPLFSISYDSLAGLIEGRSPDELTIGYLSAALDAPRGLSEGGEILRAKESLESWTMRAKETPYAILLEEILGETGAWRCFHERQRYVNAKKFIRLVEEFESRGLTGLEIKEKLVRASARSDEAKANVSTEGMDAVKIMTVHAAKGLQFPMVFLPYLDETAQPKTGNIVMDNNGGRLVIGYEEDSRMRKTMPVFQKHREKMEDEEKRLFYVAATRAMDYLCMSGALGKRVSGKLAYLFEAFNLSSDEQAGGAAVPFRTEWVRAGVSGDIPAAPEGMPRKGAATHMPEFRETVSVGPVSERLKQQGVWRDVTEETDDIRREHGEDWVVLGRALHKIFEGMSKGTITGQNRERKIVEILKNEVLSDGDLERMSGIISSELRRLDDAGYVDAVIMPRDGSYAETPFILELGRSVYKGRIDRIIIRDGTAHVYDYKTYPVAERELPELPARYSFQMEIYRKAAERLFSLRTEGHLFLTHELKIIDV